MSNEVYVVVYGEADGLNNEVMKVFKDEDKAKKYINEIVDIWLKNQAKYDPQCNSGGVEFGDHYGDEYYVKLNVGNKRRPNWYSYYDILRRELV